MAGDPATDQQGLLAFGSFIGLDGFDVKQMTDYTILQQDADVPKHVAGDGSQPACLRNQTLIQSFVLRLSALTGLRWWVEPASLSRSVSSAPVRKA